MVATLDHTPMTFDGLTDNAAFTNSDGLVINGTAPTVRSASAIHGDRGIRWNAGTAGRLMFDYGSNQTARSIMSSGYFRVNAWSAAHMYMGALFSAQTSGTAQGDWRINLTSHTVSIRNASTAADTSAEVLALNTIYRYEWKITVSTNTQELSVFEGEDSSPLFALSSSGFTLNADRVFYVGPYVAASGFDVDFDTLQFANDFVGPFITTTPNPTAGLMALL